MPYKISDISMLVMKQLQSPKASFEVVEMDMTPAKLCKLITHFEEVEGGKISIPKPEILEKPIAQTDMEDDIYVEQYIFFNGSPGETEVRYRFNKTTKIVTIEDILIA